MTAETIKINAAIEFNSIQRDIIGLLKRKSDLTKSQILKSLSNPIREIQSNLDLLVKAGFIKKIQKKFRNRSNRSTILYEMEGW